MKTYSAKTGEVEKKWVLIDAADKPLGRVASKAASIIRGKHKPTYTPHIDTGDNVIIINIAKVKMTGRKWDQKTYYWHTGYPGGIKSTTAKEIMEKKPTDLMHKAIIGMLPKNRLGRVLATNFRLYETDEHPHSGQTPEVVSI
jgi:large subunit ribosomal protein L13